MRLARAASLTTTMRWLPVWFGVRHRPVRCHAARSSLTSYIWGRGEPALQSFARLRGERPGRTQGAMPCVLHAILFSTVHLMHARTSEIIRGMSAELFYVS